MQFGFIHTSNTSLLKKPPTEIICTLCSANLHNELQCFTASLALCLILKGSNLKELAKLKHEKEPYN